MYRSFSGSNLFIERKFISVSSELGVFHINPSLAAKSQNVTDSAFSAAEMLSLVATVYSFFNGSVS
jgi:hypothetical protein